MLMVACSVGDLALVDLLIARAASLDLEDTDPTDPGAWTTGFTALMNAAAYGHTAIVRRLLQSGARADLRMCSNGGFTAVEVAQYYGNSGCVAIIRASLLWHRIRRFARIVGASAVALLRWYELTRERHYQPGARGALLAEAHFRAAANEVQLTHATGASAGGT
jgi:hypothetical protein